MIVGAGSAGCVLAHRLSEDPTREVILLEAGSAETLEPTSDSFFDLLQRPGRSWNDLRAARVAGTRPVPYRVGRGLGGSSAINAMLATPGGPYTADHLIPMEYPQPAERGSVDRALLLAAPDAEPVRLTRRAGRRIDAATAYLRPARSRSNLSVRGQAEVDQVLMMGTRAVGVRLRDGTEIRADQVVLSAGALASPVILLRSGVAVPGIGEGLQDHVSAPITLDLYPDARCDPAALASTTLLTRGEGQILPMNHLGRQAAGLGLLMAAQMRVHSRGRVRLDPETTGAQVEFNLLSDPRDRQALAELVATMRALLATGPFHEIAAGAYIDEFGTSVSHLDSETAIWDWLGDHVGEYAHAGCTLSVGKVLDTDCVVLGHEGLRVCDASAFATLPTVNTHIPTVMLAETMAARWIAAEAERA